MSYDWWKWSIGEFSYGKSYHLKTSGLEAPANEVGAKQVIQWWKDHETGEPPYRRWVPGFEYAPDELRPDIGWYFRMSDAVCNAIIKG